MSHIMIDCETIGTRAGCVVLSIGAVEFNYATSTLGKEFYVVINRADSSVYGLVEDENTLAWWSRQSKEARKVLEDARGDGENLEPALMDLSRFIKSFRDPRVWSCGADFDLPIIAHLYAVTELPLPWRYVNSRCYRTLKNLVPGVEMKRTGTHHNALDDAKAQAVHAMLMLQEIAKVAK